MPVASEYSHREVVDLFGNSFNSSSLQVALAGAFSLQARVDEAMEQQQDSEMLLLPYDKAVAADRAGHLDLDWFAKNGWSAPMHDMLALCDGAH